MSRAKQIPAAIVGVLALAALACSLGAAPTPPASPIPVSTEAAVELESALETAAASEPGSEVTLTMTEEQVTSYVNNELAEQPDSPFTDAQVYLRDGQIQVHGNATVEGLTAPMQLVLDVAPNEAGGLDIAIAQARFGPLPMPDSLLDQLSTGLDDTLGGQFSPEQTGMRVTSVEIADGEMVLTGTRVE